VSEAIRRYYARLDPAAGAFFASAGDLRATAALASTGMRAGLAEMFFTGAYSAWRQHLALLLAQARPELDAPLVAHLLLALLAAEPYAQLRLVEQQPLSEIQAALRTIAAGALGETPP